MFEAARDDRGVRGGAAQVGDEAAELVLLEQDHVGGRQVVRDQDQLVLLRELRRRHVRLAARSAPSARARPPAARRPCARAGRRPRSPRTARPASPSAAPAPTRRCSCRSRISSRGACDSGESSRIIRCRLRKALELRRARRPASGSRAAPAPARARAIAGVEARRSRRAPPARDLVVRRPRARALETRCAWPMAMPPETPSRGGEANAALIRLRRTCRRSAAAMRARAPRPRRAPRSRS